MAKKILVVDDDEGILEAFRAILESSNYNVVTESDPLKLKTIVSESAPDLILLDVLLSGGDGRELCKELKSKTDTQNIPVIMVSAHPNANKSAKEVGADDFLEKPFDIEILLKKIKNLIK